MFELRLNLQDSAAHPDTVQRLGCPDTKVCVLPVGIDVAAHRFHDRAGRTSDEIRVLSVARLVKIKGLEYAIRAFARLPASFPAAIYDIIGAGPDETRLRRLTAELQLDEYVRFHGAQDQTYVRDALLKADIFVLPSINVSGDQEAMSVALVEAQAAGLPVVATRTGGIPEVVRDGESGYLVEDRNSGALADRLLLLAQRPGLRWSMGREGRRHVEQNFDARTADQRLVSVYEQVRQRAFAASARVRGR